MARDVNLTMRKPIRRHAGPASVYVGDAVTPAGEVGLKPAAGGGVGAGQEFGWACSMADFAERAAGSRPEANSPRGGLSVTMIQWPP